MKIGYARISTDDQKLHLQIDALKKVGCTKIFRDTMSGAKAERPGLGGAMDVVRDGDTLVVWRLDRLGRSMRDLINISEKLKIQNVQLQSLTEKIDTTTSAGKLLFHFFSMMAEYERNLIRERTNAGLAAARARGFEGGRPVSLNSSKRKIVVDMYLSKKHSLKQICEIFKISKPTIYNYVNQAKVKI